MSILYVFQFELSDITESFSWHSYLVVALEGATSLVSESLAKKINNLYFCYFQKIRESIEAAQCRMNFFQTKTHCYRSFFRKRSPYKLDYPVNLDVKRSCTVLSHLYPN